MLIPHVFNQGYAHLVVPMQSDLCPGLQSHVDDINLRVQTASLAAKGHILTPVVNLGTVLCFLLHQRRSRTPSPIFGLWGLQQKLLSVCASDEVIQRRASSERPTFSLAIHKFQYLQVSHDSSCHLQLLLGSALCLLSCHNAKATSGLVPHARYQQ